MARLYSIGEIARRTGLSVSAIRFYEEKGLVVPARLASGQRRFMASDIRRLSFVLIAQRLGFSLADIQAQLARLPQGRTPTKSDWGRISKSFARDIDQQIADLTRLRDRLDGCIGCGCLSLEACSLYNAGDKARLDGTGPRLLLQDRLSARAKAAEKAAKS